MSECMTTRRVCDEAVEVASARPAMAADASQRQCMGIPSRQCARGQYAGCVWPEECACDRGACIPFASWPGSAMQVFVQAQNVHHGGHGEHGARIRTRSARSTFSVTSVISVV